MPFKFVVCVYHLLIDSLFVIDDILELCFLAIGLKERGSMLIHYNKFSFDLVEDVKWTT